MRSIRKYFILISMAALAACNNNDKGTAGTGDSLSSDPEMAKLQKENAELNSQVQEQTAAVDSFMSAFNEIQDNLNTIKEKEKIVANASKEGNVKAKEDQIIEDIQAIYELMEKNRQKVNSLSSKLKKANVQIDQLNKMIENLNAQLQAKDGEIAELKSQLEKQNIEINELVLASQVKDDEIAQKTSKLNTAYYAYGTAKELKRQGVITKEGGFIGIGKSDAMMKDFNKNYFTKIDITQITSIPLAVKKAKLLTSHPSGSYKFDGPEGKVEKLTITNPEEFWSNSKYLVIVTE
jgi:outer membrane murein-binding lipoprotein Lpp